MGLFFFGGKLCCFQKTVVGIASKLHGYGGKFSPYSMNGRGNRIPSHTNAKNVNGHRFLMDQCSSDDMAMNDIFHVVTDCIGLSYTSRYIMEDHSLPWHRHCIACILLRMIQSRYPKLLSVDDSAKLRSALDERRNQCAMSAGNGAH